eukprot:gene6007-12112_t
MSGFGFGAGKQKPELKKINNNEKLNDVETIGIIKSTGPPTIDKHCKELNTKYPGLRIVHSDPPVIEVDNFFSHETCDDFISKAQDKGVQISSRTFSPLANVKRTSTTWYLPYPDAAELLSKANDLTRFPISHYEEPQVVRYEMGQQFSWHYDTIPPSLMTTSGQRLATLLVYLNDVDEGGATCFKDLNIKVKPVKGKALLFFPAYEDGTPDDRTLHAGQIALDTKWIAQIWIHAHDYTPSSILDADSQSLGLAAVDRLRAAYNNNNN